MRLVIACFFVLSLGSLAIQSYLKRRWVFSRGLREMLAKHWIMLTCDSRGVTEQGSTDFTVEPDDVFVVTFGRSGTMFMINLLHQLRTGGDDSFEDIQTVGRFFVPMSGLGREKLSRPQVGAPPRLFFTHGLPHQTPRASYFIYIQRHPRMILKSWYTFQMQMYGFRPEDLSFEDYYFNCVRKHCVWPANSLFHNFAMWWERRKIDNMLWLRFEDFNRDSTAALVERIQRFLRPLPKMNRNVSSIMDNIEHQFLSKRPKQFDVHPYTDFIDDALTDCARQRDDLKIRREYVGIKPAHDLNVSVEFSETLRLHLERYWRLIVYPVTGFRDYQDSLKLSVDSL